MATFADIRKANESPYLTTGTAGDTPDGYFTATVKVLGLTTTYLLKGSPEDVNVASAPVIGRIELPSLADSANEAPVAYKGDSIKGGTYLGSVYTFERSFKAML